jgi:PAS domain-containing protein
VKAYLPDRPIPALAATVSGLVASAVILGWATRDTDVALTHFAASGPRMLPATAVAFLLCALSVGIASYRHGRAAVLVCASGILLIGCLRLIGSGHPFTMSLLELPGSWGVRPGRMSPATAASFILLGVALLLPQRGRAARPFQWLLLVVLLVGWLGLARYLYGGEPLVPYATMAMDTALLFILLAVGSLPLHTDAPLMRLLSSSGAAGASARVLLPTAIILPLFLAWVPEFAQHAHWIGAEASLSLYAMSTVVVLGAIVWINATRLEQSDERGRQEQRERENTQRRTRLIIENALDAVVSIDSAGVITGWNPQAQRTFGWAESEAL